MNQQVLDAINTAIQAGYGLKPIHKKADGIDQRGMPANAPRPNPVTGGTTGSFLSNLFNPLGVNRTAPISQGTTPFRPAPRPQVPRQQGDGPKPLPQYPGVRLPGGGLLPSGQLD